MVDIKRFDFILVSTIVGFFKDESHNSELISTRILTTKNLSLVYRKRIRFASCTKVHKKIVLTVIIPFTFLNLSQKYKCFNLWLVIRDIHDLTTLKEWKKTFFTLFLNISKKVYENEETFYQREHFCFKII